MACAPRIFLPSMAHRPEPALVLTCTILAIAYWSSASRGAAARTLATCTGKVDQLVCLCAAPRTWGNGGVATAGCPLLRVWIKSKTRKVREAR